MKYETSTIVGENINGAPKIRSIYSAIQLFCFRYFQFFVLLSLFIALRGDSEKISVVFMSVKERQLLQSQKLAKQ